MSRPVEVVVSSWETEAFGGLEGRIVGPSLTEASREGEGGSGRMVRGSGSGSLIVGSGLKRTAVQAYLFSPSTEP